MPVVSLVGYTSSGKTTLFNLLTKENRETSNSLFTTLSTTTRVLKSSNEKQDLLITDTVGFISRLPPYMIDAFKSTIEESLAADLILLLIDASEDLQNISIKYSSCWDVLNELKVYKAKVFVVLTKHDRLEAQQMHETVHHLRLQDPLIISSKTGYGIHKLKNIIGCILR